MAKNTSIAQGDHVETFIGARVADGRYGSASEVVRAALRLLEEHGAKVEALRAALIEGEESGSASAFEFEAFLSRKRQEHSAT